MAQHLEGTADPAFLTRGKGLFDAFRASDRALGAAIDARIEADERVLRAVRGCTLSLMLVLVSGVVLVAARERRVRDRHERRLLVLIQAAHEIAESLDERRIVRVLERASAGLTQGPEAHVVLASDQTAHADEAAARAMKAGSPVRVSGRADDDRAAPVGAVPMMVGGRVVGALVTKPREGAPHAAGADPHTEVLLAALANYGAAALESARLFRQAHEQGRVDALTHLFNRRRLDEDIADECRRSARYHRPLSLLMVDVDHFKAYNDAHGHAAGDEALKDVAAQLRAGVRLIDSVYRFGGEEIAILLRETDVRGASIVAERLRAAIESAGKVTASFGVAELDLKQPVPSAFIEAADRALYAAKHTGRNRISLAHREEQRHLDLSRDRQAPAMPRRSLPAAGPRSEGVARHGVGEPEEPRVQRLVAEALADAAYARVARRPCRRADRPARACRSRPGARGSGAFARSRACTRRASRPARRASTRTCVTARLPARRAS